MADRLTAEQRAEIRAVAAESELYRTTTPVVVKLACLIALLDAADERDRLDAAVERVRALHRSVGIYDECDCPDEAKSEGHLDVYEVGTTCNKLYDICDECCRNGGYQTEDCANYHEHQLGETHLCPTISALDGTVACRVEELPAAEPPNPGPEPEQTGR